MYINFMCTICLVLFKKNKALLVFLNIYKNKNKI